MAEKSGFMHLPAEIRLQIYAYVSYRFELIDYGCDALFPRWCSETQDPAAFYELCRTSHQVRREAVPVLAKPTKVFIRWPETQLEIGSPRANPRQPKLARAWCLNIQLLG